MFSVKFLRSAVSVLCTGDKLKSEDKDLLLLLSSDLVNLPVFSSLCIREADTIPVLDDMFLARGGDSFLLLGEPEKGMRPYVKTDVVGVFFMLQEPDALYFL